MGMEIDSLEIAIQAQAQSASRQIDNLYSKLGTLAKALNGTTGGYRKTATEIGRVTAAVRALANTRIPNFERIVTQVSSLSTAINGLQGKKVNIEVGVDIPKSASQLQYAIDKAADSVGGVADEISEKLINEYALKGKAKTAMRAAVNEMVSELASGFDGEGFAKNIFYNDDLRERLSGIIRDYGKIGSELVGDEKRISEALSGTDFVSAKTDIGKIKSVISEIDDPTVAAHAEEAILDSILSASDKAMNALRKSFDDTMKIASNEMTLNIDVNQDKIVRDIQNAINRATKVEYKPVEVTLAINKQNITDKVTQELQNVNVGRLPQIADAYERLLGAIATAHKGLDNSGVINNFVNALTRLTNVDLGKFDIAKFGDITNTVSTLASTDVSGSVSKLVSALARLANVGDTVNITAQALPALGAALRDVFDNIASIDITDVTERIFTAFTRLATSGQKASTAAQNLPNVTAAVRGFFDAMADAPAINDTTLRMVESFTALATTGRRIGSVGNQVTKAFNDVDNAGNKTVRTFDNVSRKSNLVVDAFKKMLGACKSVASGIGNCKKKILSHFKSIGNGSNHIQKATLSLKNLLQVALGFYGIRSVFNWGKEAVEFASDLTEVQNVVENSFGTKGTKNIEQFADTARDSFGMTELTAKKVASRYQAMGNAMGITSGQVAQATQNIAKNLNADLYDTTGEAMGAMSINLTKLAADMASFYNVEQDAAAEALNAVYTGQTRPLRQYGLDLTQATLEEWAHKRGIEGKISAMSQAEKTMLRYQYVMSQTSTIQGDFTRTVDTWANQVRLLKQNLQALGGVVGGTLINAFKPLVSWLNTAISAVTSFAETVGNALGKIFGWKILHTPASNAADAYNTLSDGLDNAGTSGEDAAGGIGDATKAAEEYKNTVLGFDELNKLNDVKDPTSTSGSGKGSGGSGGGSAIPSADGSGADFQIIKQQSWLEDYKSSIDSLFELGRYISDALTKAMESIKWNEIYAKARNFGTGLANFLNGLITPQLFSALGGTIAGAINTVLNAEDAFLDKFDFTNLGNSIAAGINRFFKDWDAGLTASVFYKTINGIADTIVAEASNIEWGRIGNKISTCVRTALGGIEWKEKVYPAAASFGTGLATFLNGLISPDTFGTIGETAASAINTALKRLNTFGNTFNFTNFGNSIAAAIRRFFYTWDASLTADSFSKLAKGILTAIRTSMEGVNWAAVGSKIRVMLVSIEWGDLLKGVGEAIMTGINSALDLASGLFDGTPILGVIEDLKTKLNGAVNKIDFPKISKGIGDIVDALSPAVEGFGKGLIDALGKFAEIGAATLNFIGMGLQVIANALNSFPPGTLEAIGNSLGKVAGALLAIKLADKGVTTILSLIGGLTGGGTAAAVGETATAIGVAGTNATTAVAPVSTFFKTVVTKADPVALVAGSLMTFAQSIDEARFHAEGGKGPVTDFYTAVEGMRGVLSDDLLNKLQGMAIEFANNGIEGEEAAKKLADFFTNEKIDPATIELALANVSESLGDANPFIDVIRQSFTLMGEEAVTAAQKVAMTDTDYKNLRTSIADLAAEYGLSQDEQEIFYGLLERSKQSSSTTQSAYKAVRDEIVRMYGDGSEKVAAFDAAVQEHAPNAFNTVKTGAEEADKKTSGFDGTFVGMIGKLAVQLLSLAGLGTGFKDVGDKAEGSQDGVKNLDSTIGGFISNITTHVSDALTKSTTLGENIPKGMENGIEAKKAELESAIKATMVTSPQATMQSGWSLNGASQVTFGYGDNIRKGMGNGIESKKTELENVVKSTLIKDPQTALQNGWGIHSPSSITYGYGDNIVSGMRNAIREKAYTAVESIKSMMSSMQSAITNMNSSFYSSGRTLADQFKSGLESVSFGGIVSSWQNDFNFYSLENSMYYAGRSAAQEFASGMENVHLPTPHLYFDYSVTGDSDSGYSYSYTSYIDWYKLGGFPNVGDLFIANEAGPEMVGRMGNRNVVANNMQIAEGIKAAVVDGMMEVFMATNSGNDELPYQLNIKMVTPDGEVLAQQVERGKARRDARFNTVGYSY